MRYFILALAILASSVVRGEAPEVMLTWSIANSGNDIGSTRREMRDGWPTFIEDYVRPGVAWARESGVAPNVLVMHPFGQYSTQSDDAMAIDGWDYAKAAGATWLTNDFATARAWKTVAADVDCYAYLGGAYLTDRLRDLPPPEFRAMVIRNLKPIKDAGFKGVLIDYAENAITHPFVNPNYPPGHVQHHGRSVDSIILEIADSMFPRDTGVEAAPRGFSTFQYLWPRDCIAYDPTWRLRYGGFTSEQITLYGYGTRDTNHVALGYDRGVLTGRIIRTLDYEDNPTPRTIPLARLIIGEGDVPAFNPLPFISNDIPASELTD